MERTDLRIPPAAVPTLRALVALSQDDYDSIVGAISSIHDMQLSNIPAAVSSADVDIDVPPFDVATTLVSLMILAWSRGWSEREVARNVAFAERSPAEDEATGRLLEERLARLLELRPVQVTAATVDASYQERMYEEAVVTTDVRPVFSPDGDDKPIAGLLNYELRIEYAHHDGSSEAFFVALDDTDVQELLDALTVAQKRGAALRAQLADSDLQIARFPRRDGK